MMMLLLPPTGLSRLFSIVGLLFCAAPIEAAQEPVPLRIDPGQRFQTIRGFGASGAWWTNYVAEFPEEERRRILRLLFTKDGADLSIYRYNLPAGDGPDVTDRLRRTVAVETAPGRYDFDRDWKARRILSEVRALGVERFVLFSKSPPPRMLVNGKVSGGPDGGSNLRPEFRDDFARYLLDLTAFLKKEHDLPQVTLSPINEPQWDWGRERRHQEGCQYTPAELADTFKALVAEKRRRKMTIEIEGPESGEWKSADDFARAMFDVPEIAAEVRTFAVHSYWSTPEERRKFVAWFRGRYPDKALAMTEYCQMQRGHGVGMEGALHMAGVMHEDLVVANVESWQWWLAVFTGGYNDALIYAHPRSRKIEPTKRLWAMGNFSRFVRPGATRIAADAVGLKVSAYLSADRKQTAVVVINPGEATRIHPELAGGKIGSIEAHVTTEEQDLASMKVPDPASVEIPARSVTTLVLTPAAGSSKENP